MKRVLLTMLALLPTIALATINTIVVNKTGVTVSPGHTGNIATSQSTVVTATVNVPGPQGIQGVPGEGVPTGGTDGQVLTKKGQSNYSTHWQDPAAGASSWNDLEDKPDVVIQREDATLGNISTGSISVTGRIDGNPEDPSSVIIMNQVVGVLGGFNMATIDRLIPPYSADARYVTDIFADIDSIPSVCGVDPTKDPVYDGAPALSCAIDSGNLAFSYDALGQNPLPEMLPYTVKLYEVGLNNNEPVTPDTFKWSVPTSNSLLVQGQYSTQSTFTPAILGNYSANRTNWVKAVLTYGLKTCIALVPVSVTKEGQTGADGDGASISVGSTTTLPHDQAAYVTFTGPSTARLAHFGIPEGHPGSAADVTKAAVTTTFAATQSDDPLVLRPTSAGSVTMLEVWDNGNYTRFALTSTGLITVTTPTGVQLLNFTPTGSVLTLKSSSGRQLFKVYSGAGGGVMEL